MSATRTKAAQETSPAQDQDCAPRPCACLCHGEEEHYLGPAHIAGCAWADEEYSP